METNFNEILLLGLSKSKLARVEFWEYHQSKSYNSESVFLNELFQALFYYNDLIEGKIAELQAWGNEGIKDFILPLGPETGMKLKGDLNKQALSDLAESLLEYQKKIQKKANDRNIERKGTDSIQAPQLETKNYKLKSKFNDFGVFELPKIELLSEQSKQKLIELINSKELPYAIAMLDFLGILKHLETEYFKTKDALNKEVSKWFDSDKAGRRVKGNISTLSVYTKENKDKFTAHLHKEAVQKDYEKLK